MRAAAADLLPRLSRSTMQFVDDLTGIGSLDSLADAMAVITDDLGFAHYVLGQLPGTDYEGSNFFINNYPEAWLTEVYTRFLFGHDPVIDALADAVAPFLWEDTSGYRNPSQKQRAYLDAARSFGLALGYAVPVKAPGEPTGIVSFATKNNAPVDRRIMPFTAFVATAAYRRAVTIVQQTRSAKRPQTALDAIEIAALTGIGQGLSNYTLARRLGISGKDCTALTRRVFQKLGYTNRTLVAIRGLQLGLISFNDVLLG